MPGAAGINQYTAMKECFMSFIFRIPPDYAIVIYSVGVQQGGASAWDYLWQKSRTTRVASEAEIMMNALAYTQEPWLLWR